MRKEYTEALRLAPFVERGHLMRQTRWTAEPSLSVAWAVVISAQIL